MLIYEMIKDFLSDMSHFSTKYMDVLALQILSYLRYFNQIFIFFYIIITQTNTHFFFKIYLRY